MSPQSFFTDWATLAKPYPGKSTNEIFSLTAKKLISCVLPGVLLVLASLFRPTSVFIRDDFPTLERPTKAISGKIPGGYWGGQTALFINSALIIFKVIPSQTKYRIFPVCAQRWGGRYPVFHRFPLCFYLFP